jgi:ornithine cyclodeaminase/alanine dehydrogenase
MTQTRGNGPLRYLSRSDVGALLPEPAVQRDLAETTYRALAAGRVEQPPKPGIHPREGAFIHAMPTYLRDEDVAALKWVAGYAANKARGLPYISGIVIVNDPETGEVAAIMDAREITAARTAAASAVCVRHFAPEGWQAAALIGFGEQARYHSELLQSLHPDIRLSGYDRHPERVSNGAHPAVSARAAVADADVVVTSIPLSTNPTPSIAHADLRDRSLVVAIDFDASVATDVAEQADLFLVDDREQFDYYRELGYFAGWRAPDATIGAALHDHRRGDRVLCCPLGVAALDAAFAAQILRAATEAGLGQSLSP